MGVESDLNLFNWHYNGQEIAWMIRKKLRNGLLSVANGANITDPYQLEGCRWHPMQYNEYTGS